MSVLVIASPAPLVGKTAVAVGLARCLAGEGRRLALLRLADDTGAAPDAALFAALPFNSEQHRQPLTLDEAAAAAGRADIALVEAPAGDVADMVAPLRARAIAVLRYPQASEEASLAFCRALGDALLGVAVTAVPRRHLEAARQRLAEAGLKVFALIPEDRTLISPTIAELAEALAAQTMFLDDQEQAGTGPSGQVLDRILISSVSADPGQGYFANYHPNAVIVRNDKPDLQLAALNAGVRCLIITGGLQPLFYVLQRAEEEEIPMLLTGHDTRATVAILEDLYLRTRFGGQTKVQRMGELLGEALEGQALAAIGVEK